MSRELDPKRKIEAARLRKAFSTELTTEFRRNRDQYYDANTKGGNYEKIASRFLATYLGEVFEFHERAQVLDCDLQYINIFARGGNNFDVVATYKPSAPRVVMKMGETAFLPLDSVAFLVEVKQDISRSFLERDLQKLRKFDKLPVTQDRFGGSYSSTPFMIKRPGPIKILLYDDGSIETPTLKDLLAEYSTHWDILVIASKDHLWANLSLPVFGEEPKKDDPVFGSRTNGLIFSSSDALLKMLMLLLISLPTPFIVDTSKLFLKLLRADDT